jgi:hypothetical protein
LQSEKPSMHGFKAQNKQWKNTWLARKRWWHCLHSYNGSW